MTNVQTDLEHEIEDLIRAGIEAKQVMPANWITEAILERHPGITGADKDFYVRCAFSHVRDTVRQALRSFRGDPADAHQQLRLPGYEFLQKAYLVDRTGVQSIVPLAACTNAELLVKIAEYLRMSDGCIKHARELERYRELRFGQPASQ